MPSRKIPNSGEFKDIAHPINAETREKIQKAILEAYDAPETEAKYRGTNKHADWKAGMIKHSEEVISEVDSVLVLNYTKNGIDNYIGGATFLEMYDAFRLGKKIYMMNDIPEGLLKDEIIGFNPIIINGNLNKIK